MNQPLPGIHHVSVGITDLARAKAFYEPLLQIVGLRLLKETDQAAHYGIDQIIFSLETPVDGRRASPGNGSHIAFAAPNTATVDRFHREALELGAKDAGVPGPRPKYSEGYYGAFILDPDGNKLEAVFHS